jgi:glutamine amidotransferase
VRVGVIDYGVGNLGSVVRAVEKLSVSPVLVNRAADLHASDCLILPGVGNFADCMSLLNQHDWADTLREEVVGFGRPLLGLCVGMQLLASRGDEGAIGAADGGLPGLGLIPGRVSHLRDQGCELRVAARRVECHRLDLGGGSVALRNSRRH